jgi:hypothetical protein
MAIIPYEPMGYVEVMNYDEPRFLPMRVVTKILEIKQLPKDQQPPIDLSTY